MRVLMVSQTYPPLCHTGAPLQAMYLTRELFRHGVDIEVLTSGSPRKLPDDQKSDGIKVHSIPFASLPGLKSATRFFAAALHASRLRDWDVIHGHALSPLVLGIAIARKRRTLPMLVKPSIGGDHEEGEITRIIRSPAALILRKALQCIDRFAILDEFILSDLRSLGIPENAMISVDNGVNTEHFRPASNEEKESIRIELGIKARTVILFCGQLTSRKGLPELLTAWTGIYTEFPDTILAIAGDGPLAAQVQANAETSEGTLIFLGKQVDIAPVIRISDALILPSRFESFGNVVTEALASGVPVLSTRCGVSPRVVIPGRTGWLIEDTTVRSIQDTLREAMSTRENWPDLGTECRATAKYFSFRRIAEHYLKIYESMLASCR